MREKKRCRRKRNGGGSRIDPSVKGSTFFEMGGGSQQIYENLRRCAIEGESSDVTDTIKARFGVMGVAGVLEPNYFSLKSGTHPWFVQLESVEHAMEGHVLEEVYQIILRNTVHRRRKTKERNEICSDLVKEIACGEDNGELIANHTSPCLIEEVSLISGP